MIIGMIADAEIEPVANITAPRWESYCRKHGLEFVRRSPMTDRPASWSKIQLAQRLLTTNQVVAIVDADSVPLNFEFSLGKGTDTPVTVGQDWNGLCASLMIFQPESWARWFLEAVWNCGPIVDDQGNDKWEQSAMKHLCKFNEVSKNVKLDPRLHSDLRTYTPGDFLLHLPCMTTAGRCQTLLSL